MAKAKIIVRSKAKRKSDRELRKLLKQLEVFKPQELETKKPKRLIPIEEVPKREVHPKSNTITFPQVKEKAPKKKRKKSLEVYQRKHKSAKTKAEEIRTPAIEKTVKSPSVSEYIPVVDIFEVLEEAVYTKIPNETMVWRKGHKGSIPIDLTSVKQQAIFLLRDYAVSDSPDVIDYFQRNENAILESIDSIRFASKSDDFNTLLERFLSLINMANALSADLMYYNEISEILDIY